MSKEYFIEDRELSSWEEYHSTIAQISKTYGQYQDSISKTTRKRTLLYRGQPCAGFKLISTLDRVSPGKKWSFHEYSDLIRSIARDIENNPVCPNCPKIDPPEISNNPSKTIEPFDSYMVYLRHHGFPSPLLDWTEDPMIAAYFSFQDYPDETMTGRSAIFVYIEKQEYVTSSEYPEFEARSLTKKNIPRDIAQKTWFTYAFKKINAQTTIYAPFYEVSEMPEEKINNATNRPQIIRITLPHTEKDTVRKYLDSKNINYDTLMDPEGTYIKSLSDRTERPTC